MTKPVMSAAEVTAFLDREFPQLLSGHGHFVIESVGPATWDKSLRSLVPGGRLVICGGTSGPKVEVTLPRLFFKQHEIIGSTMGSYEEWAEVADFVAQGLPIVVDQAVPLDAYPDALARLEKGEQLGKLVLQH